MVVHFSQNPTDWTSSVKNNDKPKGSDKTKQKDQKLPKIYEEGKSLGKAILDSGSNTREASSPKPHFSEDNHDKTKGRVNQAFGTVFKEDKSTIERDEKADKKLSKDHSKLLTEWESAKKEGKQFQFVSQKIHAKTTLSEYKSLKADSALKQSEQELSQAKLGSSKHAMLRQKNEQLREDLREAKNESLKEAKSAEPEKSQPTLAEGKSVLDHKLNPLDTKPLQQNKIIKAKSPLSTHSTSQKMTPSFESSDKELPIPPPPRRAVPEPNSLQRKLMSWTLEFLGGKGEDGKRFTGSKQKFLLDKTYQFLAEARNNLPSRDHPAYPTQLKAYNDGIGKYEAMKDEYKAMIENNTPQDFLPEDDPPLPKTKFIDRFPFSLKTDGEHILKTLGRDKTQVEMAGGLKINKNTFYSMGPEAGYERKRNYTRHASELVKKYFSNHKETPATQKPIIEFIALMIAIKYQSDSYELSNRSFLQDIGSILPEIKSLEISVKELNSMEKTFLEGINNEITPKDEKVV